VASKLDFALYLLAHEGPLSPQHREAVIKLALAHFNSQPSYVRRERLKQWRVFERSRDGAAARKAAPKKPKPVVGRFDLARQEQMDIHPPGHPKIHLRRIYWGGQPFYAWCKIGRAGGVWIAENGGMTTFVDYDVRRCKIGRPATMEAVLAWATSKAGRYTPPLQPTRDWTVPSNNTGPVYDPYLSQFGPLK
jgi:hypothetical protein